MNLPTTLQAAPGRKLQLEDLVLLDTPLGISPQPLKELRDVHHQAARLLATGMKAVEVSAIVGLSQSRLSILKADPAFAELMEHYRGREDARFVDVQERAVSLGLTAMQVLQDRMLDNPAEIGTESLVKVMTAALDRGGHAPVTKSESKSLSVVLGADDLALIKEKATLNGSGTTIARPGAVARQLSNDPGTRLGEVILLRPEGAEAKEGSGEPGEGTQL